MKESIQTFENARFGQIRTSVTESGEPLFCLVDVCRALGLKNPRDVKTRLKQDGVFTTDGVSRTTNQYGKTTEQVVELNFITEPNLYKCIFQSRKKEAEAFQDWVCGEVLPAIRKTGGYMAAREDETPEQVMARALLIAQDTINRVKQRADRAEAKVVLLQSQSKALSRQNSELQNTNAVLESCNKGLQQTVKNMQPAAVFAKAISTSPQSILVKELSVMISQNNSGIIIGQNQLFAWLREHGYLCSVRGDRYNLPTQKSINMGLIEIKKSTYTNATGDVFTTNTPMITGKGQIYFVNRVLYDLINEREYNQRNGKGGQA